MKKCPKCGREYIEGSVKIKEGKCECGYIFISSDNKPKTKICQACGKENHHEVAVCPCGQNVFKPKREPLTECPFCASELKLNVLKCQHCGEWLDNEHRNEEEKVRNAQKATGTMAKLIGLLIALSLLLPVLMKDCK